MVYSRSGIARIRDYLCTKSKCDEWSDFKEEYPWVQPSYVRSWASVISRTKGSKSSAIPSAIYTNFQHMLRKQKQQSASQGTPTPESDDKVTLEINNQEHTLIKGNIVTELGRVVPTRSYGTSLSITLPRHCRFLLLLFSTLKIFYPTYSKICFSGGVILDFPLGLTETPYDVELTESELDQLARWLSAANTARSFFVATYVTLFNLEAIKSFYASMDLTDYELFYACNVNASRRVSDCIGTPSVQMILIAFNDTNSFDKRGSALTKQNVIYHATPQTSIPEGVDSAYFSPCIKSPIISRTLCQRFLAPQTDVLVLCGGLGGDMVGSVAAGMRVVQVELDPALHSASVDRMRQYALAQSDDLEVDVDLRFKPSIDSSSFGQVLSDFKTKHAENIDRNPGNPTPTASPLSLTKDKGTKRTASGLSHNIFSLNS